VAGRPRRLTRGRQALRAVLSAVTSPARGLLVAAVGAFAVSPPPRRWPLRTRGRDGRPGRDLVWVLDVVAGIVVTAVTAGVLAQRNDALGEPAGPQLVLAASLALGAAVAARDRWPLAAWRSTLALCLLTPGLLQPLLTDTPLLATHLLAVLVTSYTAVVRAERPIALGAWGLTMLTLLLLPVSAADSADFSAEEWAALVAVLTGPILLGHNVRVRRSAQAALSDEQRRSEAARAERAVLEERARIARELHDVVAHHMTHIAIQAEAAPLRNPDDPAALTEDLSTIRGTALTALAETRRILGVLRDDRRRDGVPPPAPGLAQLEDLAQTARAAGHDVTLDVAVRDDDVTPGIALSVHRIVQESLSNVVRHAPGAPVTVAVRRGVPAGRELHVDVVNGPPTAAADSTAELGGGHGLVGMRERVAMLDGQLRTGPTADGGYAVSVTLPLGAA